MANGILSTKFWRAHLRKLDWWLLGSSFFLSLFGLVAIYSASLRKQDFFNFEKQVVFLAIGLVLVFLISVFDYHVLKSNSYLILAFYILCVLILVGAFFFTPIIRGKRGWYKIGSLSFDSIEPAKIALVMMLAKYFSMRHAEMYRFWHIVLSGIYVLIPSLLIFLQPEMGSVLILLIVWISILFISGIKMKHFLILCLCALIVLSLSWGFILRDYQRERIINFVSPKDPLGGSWSQNQAKIAIGSGGIWGKGLGNGTQTQYGFLPEPHTDFIFSVIAEEFGLVGVSALFFLYSILIWRTIKIAVRSRSNFPRLFAAGFSVIINAQIFINVGMNVGLLPVIGIYLPLVSYGGSGLLGTLIGIGVLESIKSKT